jgi:hypothetical protein
MTKEEFFKDVDIEDVIDYFGVDDILDSISSIDIANHCDDIVLSCIDDDSLIAAISDPEVVLDILDNDIIAEHLEEKGYKVSDTLSEVPTLDKIKEICREIQPSGYIDKENAKKLICDYIDFWMTNSF